MDRAETINLQLFLILPYAPQSPLAPNQHPNPPTTTPFFLGSAFLFSFLDLSDSGRLFNTLQVYSKVYSISKLFDMMGERMVFRYGFFNDRTLACVHTSQSQQNNSLRQNRKESRNLQQFQGQIYRGEGAKCPRVLPIKGEKRQPAQKTVMHG